MSIWLKFLPLEIQGVTDLVEPTDEIKNGERVVGVVSDELKQLWTLYNSVKKSGELMTIEMKYTKATDEEHGKISELMAKARALELIFWIGALDELQLWSHPEQTGLRVGWQVVEFKHTDLLFPFRL